MLNKIAYVLIMLLSVAIIFGVCGFMALVGVKMVYAGLSGGYVLTVMFSVIAIAMIYPMHKFSVCESGL